ncbi:MAG: hypothetical protein AABZ39_11720 [Spirochaetota bacterium]
MFTRRHFGRTSTSSATGSVHARRRDEEEDREKRWLTEAQRAQRNARKGTGREIKLATTLRQDFDRLSPTAQGERNDAAGDITNISKENLATKTLKPCCKKWNI